MFAHSFCNSFFRLIRFAFWRT